MWKDSLTLKDSSCIKVYMKTESLILMDSAKFPSKTSFLFRLSPYSSRPVSGSRLGMILPFGDVSQCLGTFFTVTAGGWNATGIQQVEAGMLLSIQQSTGQALHGRTMRPRRAAVPKLCAPAPGLPLPGVALSTCVASSFPGFLSTGLFSFSLTCCLPIPVSSKFTLCSWLSSTVSSSFSMR